MKRALNLLFILSLMWSEENTADQKLPDAVQAVRTFHERIAVEAMEDACKLILESALETLKL